MTKKKSISKSSRLLLNLARSTLQYIQGKRYSPMTAEELIQELNIPESVQSSFRLALDALQKEGEIVLKEKRYCLKGTNTQLVTGKISVHAIKGFGFVKSEQGEVFIPKHSIGDAVHGDQVEVEIIDVTPKGPEGRIIAILERSRSHLACTILEKAEKGYLAYAALLGPKRTIVVAYPENETLKEGDRIICRVLDWNNEEDDISAVLTRVIGHISDPSCDVRAAIEEFELPDGFTKEAIEEAKAFGTRVTPKGRLDLTKLECVTIDPDTAKDFDDAISLSKDEHDHFLLGVHIADVAAYVQSGSHLDQESFLRCNSTYFPGFCLPMLPQALSNELCSLKPDVNRLTVSVLARFDKTGTLLDYRIERSCIKSKKRLTYGQALLIIEKKEESPFLPLLELMVELCHLFKEKRSLRGSIDFSLKDSVVIVDAQGVPLRIDHVEYDITHQMIEEFMLKANEIVSTHLAKQGKPQIYRIHEEPSPETFEDFYHYARSLGFTLPQKPDNSDLQKLFKEAKGSGVAEQLSVSFIRSMKLAFYSLDEVGHYGLALSHYCHFTSPIRRYTDLIIQRLLFDENDPAVDLKVIAAACSEKERLSMRAESSVVQLKKLRLAANVFTVDPDKTYSATITKIKPFAIFFQIPDFDLEGSLHVSELGNDYFEYDAKRVAFRGSRSGKTFSCGEVLAVRLTTLDLIRQSAVWEIVGAKKSDRNDKSRSDQSRSSRSRRR